MPDQRYRKTSHVIYYLGSIKGFSPLHKSLRFSVKWFNDIPAHSSPLGLTFAPDSWPQEYRGNLLVAYHGSWNRSTPTGYKIVRMIFDAAGVYRDTEDFIFGWLVSASNALGRPVDLVFGLDRALYVSDDKAGVIYRIFPQKVQ